MRKMLMKDCVNNSNINKNKKSQPKRRHGFTIVEVTLVTAFIAMLLIVIATILANMISMYQKGMTLKTINSAGRNLVAELTASINAAPSIDTTSLCNSLLDNSASVNACINDNASHYIFQSVENQSYHDNIVDTSGQVAQGTVQYGGVFCTGNYSYVWNTKYGRENNNSNVINIVYSKNGSTEQINDFKIARFKDRTYRACSTNVSRSDYNTVNLQNTRTINITTYANGGSLRINNIDTDFLETSVDGSGRENDAEINLDLYELTIFPVSQDAVTLRAFFSGTFILGTERGNASILRSGDYCDVTNGQNIGSGSLQDLGSEFNYCGINKFNFAARTAGSGV